MPSDGKDTSPATPAVRWIEVAEEEAGQRIDNYLLARLKGVPKSRIYRILRSGEVRINSKRVEASQRVIAGDRIRIPPVRVAAEADPVPAPHFKLPILFEDEALLAIDKPAGLAVHGGSGVAHGVIESLRAMRPEARFLELVHRLDRDTSGVILVAKNDDAHNSLTKQLRERTVEKTYLALVEGTPKPVEGVIDAPIARDPKNRQRMAIIEGGRDSVTAYRLLERFEGYSLVEARPKTGRTHQIRVHLTAIGHPIVGDKFYGKPSKLVARQFLHATRITFTHPQSGERVEFEASLAADLARAVSTLTES